MLKLVRVTTVPISLKVLLRGQLQFMSRYFEVIGISSEGKELSEVERQEGIRVHAVNMSRKITPFQDLVALLRLFILFVRIRPDIVHTHTPKAGLLGMLAAKLAFVPKRFHTVAGMPLMETSGIKRKILECTESITYQSASAVFPNSYGLYKFILDQRMTSKSKLKVIANGSSNGIDTQYFNPDMIRTDKVTQLRNDLAIKSDDFVFIYVGRIVQEKGVDELVQAFLSLNKPEVKLVLVGSFEEKLDPISEFAKNEIINNEYIKYVGYKEDVRPYFAIANALVFPSYREGFPNVVMQAGAMGIPSIVSDINGCNEIIINKENGLIVPVKNYLFLKNAMREMIVEADLYMHLKGNCRKLIEERYDCMLIWNNILEIYKS